MSRTILTITAITSLMIGMNAFAVGESCCDKAKAAGKSCSHPCCTEKALLGQTCFKCNPDKVKTCCDKAQVKNETCNHPCCKSAASVGSVCFKCNPEGVAVLFVGKDLDNWNVNERSANNGKNKWTVGVPTMANPTAKSFEVKKTDKPADAAIINDVTDHGQSFDFYSKAKFGDCRIQLDVMVPKGSNSGIYIMGEYEVQVLDSYGKEKMGNGDMGAVYGAAPPPINACKKPGEWQTYVIDFKAPTFDDAGNKTSNAKLIKVELNGKVLHENLELKGPTPGGLTGKEAATGPIMFQGNHGAVAYRRIRITQLPKE